MKITTFFLSLLNTNPVYGFKTNNLIMNYGVDGFYIKSKLYTPILKSRYSPCEPPTNTISSNRNTDRENYGFYKGPTQRADNRDTLYQPPTNTISSNRNTDRENYGFYKGPTQRADNRDTLYQPPPYASKYTSGNNKYSISGFYVGPTSCLITAESTEVLYEPSIKTYEGR